jgi:hypothetical protein
MRTKTEGVNTKNKIAENTVISKDMDIYIYIYKLCIRHLFLERIHRIHKFHFPHRFIKRIFSLQIRK